MATVTSFLEAPIPRPVLWVGTPIAAIALVSLFVFLGFPYDQLAEMASARASEASGSPVTIGELDPRVTIAGPGFTARNVTVTTREQQTLRFEQVKIRPAWSLSWLRGVPTLHLDIGSEHGDAHGDLVLSAAPGWNGEVSDVDLTMLPLPLPAGANLDARVDADIDITLAEDGPSGSLSFESAKGSVSHPDLPVELEFDTLKGNLLLGGENLAEIETLELKGPVVVATAGGTVRRGGRRGNQPLDIDVDLEIPNPGIRLLLQQTGMRIDSDGRTQLKIGGTLSQPRLR